MPDPTINSDFFGILAKILLRCWIFGFLLILVWFGVFMLAGDFIHRQHGGMFGLSSHELDVIFYCGMGLTKILILVFFLIPWAAIRLVSRKG